MIKLRILRCIDYPEFSIWACYNHKGPYKGEAGGSESEGERERFKDAMLPGFENRGREERVDTIKKHSGCHGSPQAVGEVKALLTTSLVVGDGKWSGMFTAWTWRFLLWQDGSQPWSYVHPK